MKLKQLEKRDLIAQIGKNLIETDAKMGNLR